MAQVIIERYRGLVSSVYSDSLEELHVRVIDSDDVNDSEHAHLFAACRYAAERGGFIDNMDVPNDDAHVMEFPLTRPKETTQLIAEDNLVADGDGQFTQQMDAAFAGGFLQAVGDLNDFLRKQAESEPEKAGVAYQLLHRYIDRQFGRYFDLCEDINDPNRYTKATDQE